MQAVKSHLSLFNIGVKNQSYLLNPHSIDHKFSKTKICRQFMLLRCLGVVLGRCPLTLYTSIPAFLQWPLKMVAKQMRRIITYLRVVVSFSKSSAPALALDQSKARSFFNALWSMILKNHIQQHWPQSSQKVPSKFCSVLEIVIQI